MWLGLGRDALAHDFWIDTKPTATAVGTQVSVSLYAGEQLRGDSVPRIEDWFKRFSLIQPDGAETTISGVMGDDPAGAFTVTQTGVHHLVYRSTSGFAEQEIPAFKDYLQTEGVEHLLGDWLDTVPTPVAAREEYYRCAKNLLAVGSDHLGFDRVVGLELELTALDDPFADAAAGIRINLSFRGAPLAHALVVARNANNSGEQLHARTDGSGNVRLNVSGSGFWLIKAVHLVAAPADSGLTEWMSFWASLTFLKEATN
jgi:uncharacterized GH25 family protein